MFRFACFPVKVTGTKIVSRDGEANAQIFEAKDYDEAIEKAGNHIALFEGEQIACVKVGRILTQSAENKLPIGQGAA